jgi:hypothetical protein
MKVVEGIIAEDSSASLSKCITELEKEKNALRTCFGSEDRRL